MREARRVGLSRTSFWGFTLRELYQEFAIARARQRDVFERDTVQAYQVVRIYVETMNKKRMPKLSTLVGQSEKPQSARQMAQALSVLRQRYRGRKARP